VPLGGSGPLPSILPYGSDLPPLLPYGAGGPGLSMGQGVRESPPGGAQPFQVELGSRPAVPGVSGGARLDDPNRMSRPTPERALPSQVGGAAEAAGAPPPPTG